MTGASKGLALALALLFVVGGVTSCGSGSGSGSGSPKPILVNGKCPDREPISPETGWHPGTKGQTVPDGAKEAEAVICRYETVGSVQRERNFVSERILRRDKRARVATLVDKLNALAPGREGTFNCPSGYPLSFYIGIRYLNGSEVQIEVELHSCDTARNVGEMTYFESSGPLESELESLVADRRRLA